MKKLSVLLLSVVTMGTTIVSCSKEDDSAKSASILGTWKYSKVEIKVGGQTTFKEDFTTGCAADGKFDITTFKEDNTYGETNYDAENDCAADTYNGPYSLTADNKKLTMDGEYQVDIVKLTATDMELHGTFTEQGVTAEVFINYKR